MIVIELMGGLGNQMYQYAFGKSLTNIFNCDLYLNKSNLRNYATARNLELSYFNTSFKIVDEKVKKIFINDNFNILNRVQVSIFSLGKYKKIKEDSFKDFKKMPIRNNTYYKGYFQSEAYFNAIKDVLVNDFTLANPLDEFNQKLVSRLKAEQSVFVHIRRGDFLTSNGYHKVYDKLYYEQAIQKISEKERNEQLQFYFFSDDINWVQQNFIAENYHYITHNTADESYKDLVLMSSCKYAIFGNSTFAWWANWLRKILFKLY